MDVKLGVTILVKYVRLQKSVHTGANESVSGFAATRQRQGVGTHGQKAGFIVQGVGGLIEEFIAEYVRVNGEAC